MTHTHYTGTRKQPHLGLLDLEIYIQYGQGLCKMNSPNS